MIVHPITTEDSRLAQQYLEEYQEDGYTKYKINFNNVIYYFIDKDLALLFLDRLVIPKRYDEELNELIKITGDDCSFISTRNIFTKTFYADSLDFYYENDFNMTTDLVIPHNLNTTNIIVRVWFQEKNDIKFYNDDPIILIKDNNTVEIKITSTYNINTIKVVIIKA